MSRFDRRMKGSSSRNDGPRPGTSSCSLPASSVSNNRRMLGGNFLNRQPVQVSQRKIINGTRMLQTHEEKISRLENKIENIETNIAVNVSGNSIETETILKKMDLLTSGFNDQMGVLRKYIKSLEEKIQILEGSDTVNANKNANKTVKEQIINKVELHITEK